MVNSAWVYLLFDMAYLLLGLLSALMGKLLPARFIMPNRVKWRVTDEKRFLFASRMFLYALGAYWFVFGLVGAFLLEAFSVDMFKWSGAPFLNMGPVYVVAVCVVYQRRFLKKQERN